ncbi:hypothetical protein AAHH97_02225 [Mycolicibacterium elephantis]|uniref:hypothetical protein n=1 Tax=Mycolicibacterium elephantis TaxID=81858 RepID=UPI003A89586A
MSTPQQSETATRMFSRVLGPYLAILAVVALVRASEMPTLLSEFEPKTVWPWVTGAFVLLTGLIVIALHPHWRGVPAAIVSAVGWLVALKGAFLLAIPGVYLSAADSLVDARGWLMAVYVAVAAVGLYLTYVGWAPQRDRSTASDGSSADLPKAA